MISDTDARRISSEWHGGQGSALYALRSTGAINTARQDHDCDCEIDQNLDATTGDDAAYGGLYDLQRYVAANGPRGPQEGWENLTW